MSEVLQEQQAASVVVDNSIADQFQDIPRPVFVLLALVSLRLTLSSRFWMYLRPFVTPVVTLIVLWRAWGYYSSNSTPSQQSILDMILDELNLLIGEKLREVVVPIVKDLIGILVIATFAKQVSGISFGASNPFGFKKLVMDTVYPYIRKLPPVQKELIKEKKKMEEDMEKSLKPKGRALSIYGSYAALPKKGISQDKLLKDMTAWTASENENWQSGRISGGVYHGEQKHIDFLNKIFSLYSIANPLHPDTWPSLMKCEAEVVSMAASLVGGGPDGPIKTLCGCTTSGGTESIILAIKAHRDFYRIEHGITEPEMIACVSAHAAVDKACEMLGIRLIKIPYEKDTYKMDVSSTAAAVSSNTIMIYTSAPCYPQGVIDDIRALGKIATSNNIGLHVDCCLGGFFLPFAKKLGAPNIPDFEFTVPGVTSMSLDTHKYGYALKGTSVLLYRDSNIRQFQYFCYSTWTGGLYTTPTIAGSRSGGTIAQCWASMVSLGMDGYLKCTKDIIKCKDKIKAGILKMNGIGIIGQSEAMIICMVGTDGVNIYGVYDCMAKRGWSLNSHQSPACMHLCCTVNHIGCENDFLRDLKASVEEVRGDAGAAGKSAGIYGMTGSMPAGPVEDMLRVYNDCVLKM